MDALDDEDVVLLQRQPDALFLAALGVKRVARQLDLAPGQQVDELLVEQRHVDGLKALKIRLAVRTARYTAAVDVVVIQRYGQRTLAADPQLNAQPVGERRLAAG